MARPAYQVRLSDAERGALEAALIPDETLAAFLRSSALKEAKRRIGAGAMIDAGMAAKRKRPSKVKGCTE
jgi:hypothetical protein